MSKTVKIICSVIIAGLIFLGGVFAGTVSNAEVTKEIKIGYQNDGNPDRVDYHKVYTDSENPLIMDNFLMIYLNWEKVDNVNVDLESPDLYIELNNPKDSVGLIDSKLWFDNDVAIIGRRVGESWDQVIFYEIDESDAEYIKKTIEYEG
ncbi:hypothetical protein DHX103_06140 [Planococcus sp. X10-3]|uniref:hypothetical protein n=1 Tax=Planococcus sp. X10-3 TaxID=3061240 RepID=UPI003BAE8BF5